ncbi:hypothetical protein, partial [Paenibacillus forsythiae]|uniref:hypothetical protein n=1 Tax=Paenibacillus forsythiae TaxID=365616 RepID=UPI001E30C57F
VVQAASRPAASREAQRTRVGVRSRGALRHGRGVSHLRVRGCHSRAALIRVWRCALTGVSGTGGGISSL